MKKRIIALVLVVVMSVLTLAGCGKAVNFVDDINNYAKFKDEAAFLAALKSLEIADGTFTNCEEDRVAKINAQIYNSVLTGLLGADPEHLTTGEINGGDVMYFVYYATDEAGNVYYFSNMNETTATNSGHIIRLGDVKDTDKLLVEIKKALEEREAYNLSDYIYDMYTQSELTATAVIDEETVTAEATAKCAAEHDHSSEVTDTVTLDQLKAACVANAIQTAKDNAVKAALDVEANQTYVINYTRTWTTVVDGKTVIHEQKAKYEQITLDPAKKFDAILLADSTIAQVGKTVTVPGTDAEGKPVQNAKFPITEGEGDDAITYTYSDVNILWKAKDVEPFLTFTFKPFSASTAVAPDSLHDSVNGSTSTVPLNQDSKLTYYVYPVYYVEAPAADKITGADIIKYISGSKLTATSFDAFEGAVYTAENKTVADLVADYLKVFDTANTEIYAEGTDLQIALKKYNDAVSAGGSSPTTAQKNKITEAQKELLQLQLNTVTDIATKIDEATTKDGVSAIVTEYYEGLEHSLVETYNKTIVENVQKAVWTLIQDQVEVTNYPEKLVKEYSKQIYDDYEYDYYKGSTNNIKNIENPNYPTLTDYLVTVLKCGDASKIDATIEAQAKAQIKPIIQVYFVAYYFEADAVSKLESFVEADIAAGLYTTEEDIESARKDAKLFYVDNDYMKAYKKEVGRRFYNDVIEQYGEMNIRASFMFNKLFYYLTCTDVQTSTEGGTSHTETVSKLGDNGIWTIQFRNDKVGYAIKGVGEDSHEGHNHG